MTEGLGAVLHTTCTFMLCLPVLDDINIENMMFHFKTRSKQGIMLTDTNFNFAIPL